MDFLFYAQLDFTINLKIKAIKRLQSYCEQNNKKFIFIVLTPKEAVYKDYFPKSEVNKQVDYLGLEKQLVELASVNEVNYLPIGEALFKRHKDSSEELFFFDDHHWSYNGSFIGANLLLNKIGTITDKFDDYNINLDGSYKKAFKECSYARELGLSRNSETIAPWSKTFTDEIYVSDCYDGKTIRVDKVLSNDALWGRIVSGEAIIKNKAINNDVTLLVLGDSSGSYMMAYLSQKVKNIISTHYRDCVGKKKNVDIGRLIKQYNPDIVVLEMGGPGFFNSKGDTNFKNMVF